MTARTYRGGVPAPPPSIAAEMFEAGRTNDQARLNIAAASYEHWLRENGYPTPIRGSQAPEEAFDD